MATRGRTDGRQAMFDKFTPLYDQFDPKIIDTLICLVLYPQHDKGPDCHWERLFLEAPLDHYRNFPQQPFHTRFGPVFYRGRLDGSARVLVIGQDPATDETLAKRAFVGTAGQIAQAFLAKLGITRSYLMFNSFLYGVQSKSLQDKKVSYDEPTIAAYRNRLFDRAKETNKLEAVIAFGAYARDCAKSWPGRGSLPLIELTHPTAPQSIAANWDKGLAAAMKVVKPDGGAKPDPAPFPTTGEMPRLDIPRADLPFGLPEWHGTGGKTWSRRGDGAAFESQIIWDAPG